MARTKNTAQKSLAKEYKRLRIQQPRVGKGKGTKSIQKFKKMREHNGKSLKNKQNLKKGQKIGEKIAKQIREQRSRVDLLIRKMPFQRLVRQILFQQKTVYRMQTSAVLALQQACQGFLIGLFQDSYLIAINSKRITLLQKDMALAKKIRGLKF